MLGYQPMWGIIIWGGALWALVNDGPVAAIIVWLVLAGLQWLLVDQYQT